MAQTEAGHRRNWKKWLAIYLAAAAVVYLIVFLVFFNHGGGGASGSKEESLDPGPRGRGHQLPPLLLPGPSPRPEQAALAPRVRWMHVSGQWQGCTSLRGLHRLTCLLMRIRPFTME